MRDCKSLPQIHEYRMLILINPFPGQVPVEKITSESLATKTCHLFTNCQDHSHNKKHFEPPEELPAIRQKKPSRRTVLNVI